MALMFHLMLVLLYHSFGHSLKDNFRISLSCHPIIEVVGYCARGDFTLLQGFCLLQGFV